MRQSPAALWLCSPRRDACWLTPQARATMEFASGKPQQRAHDCLGARRRRALSMIRIVAAAVLHGVMSPRGQARTHTRTLGSSRRHTSFTSKQAANSPTSRHTPVAAMQCKGRKSNSGRSTGACRHEKRLLRNDQSPDISVKQRANAQNGCVVCCGCGVCGGEKKSTKASSRHSATTPQLKERETEGHHKHT